MKKFCSFIFLLCFTCVLSSFSKNNYLKVEGFINTYGNEPFSYPCIKTSDNKVYAIIADDVIMQEIKSSQGHKIRIEGRKLKSNKKYSNPITLKNGIIEVESWSFSE